MARVNGDGTIPNGAPHVRVILNPGSASGASLRRVSEIGDALRRHDIKHEIVLTRRRGHAKELALAAADAKIDVIAVVGGDGTLNEVAQAYVNEKGDAVSGMPDLALIPSGTGGDFKKTLGLTGTLDDAVQRIRNGQRRKIDLGVLNLTTDRGDEAVHAFVNIASFGIGGRVDAIVNEAPKWLGGKASFFLATIRAMGSYKNADVRVKVDGKTWYEGKIFNVAIANGRFFGGGMMIAPHADPSDGRFEVVAIGDFTRPEVVSLSSKIYKGTHLGEAGVRVTSGTRIEAEPVHPWSNVLLDVDGEQPGKLPVRATIVKNALTFRA